MWDRKSFFSLTKLYVLTKGSEKVLEQSAFAVQCDVYRFLKYGHTLFNANKASGIQKKHILVHI